MRSHRNPPEADRTVGIQDDDVETGLKPVSTLVVFIKGKQGCTWLAQPP